MTDIELGRFLLSIVTLLVLALGCGRLFERLGMPHVIGEIAGGLILGPSLLGHVFPDVHAWIFEAFAAQGVLLSGFYWIGLLLLMFVAGFRVQHELTRDDRLIVAVMLISSVVFPMLGGWHLTALIDASRMMAPGANPVSFHLVLAIGSAVTSIPFISRIFLDLKLMDSRFAKIVLMAATLQDLVLWIALAVATGLNSGQGADGARLGTVIVTTMVFIGLSVLLGPTVLVWAGRRIPIKHENSAFVGYALVICFALTAAASLLDINVVFGALMAGIVIGALPQRIMAEAKQRISDVSLTFFVPIYFAIVGLKIDVLNQFDLEMTVLFIVVSSAVKVASVGIALRLTGLPLASAVNYGVAMNTRGGPGIVLASVALAFHIITEPFFVALVLASVVTSLVTGAWLRVMIRRGHTFDR